MWLSFVNVILYASLQNNLSSTLVIRFREPMIHHQNRARCSSSQGSRLTQMLFCDDYEISRIASAYSKIYDCRVYVIAKRWRELLLY